MKAISLQKLYLIVGLLLLTLLAGCGYHNANLYNGAEKKIYLSSWQNRTNKLSLNSDLYRSLVQWYQKASDLKTVNNQESADLILAGEITSLSLPSLSYTNSTTSQVNVILKVRYVMYDTKSKKILFEVPGEIWSESYVPNATSSSTDNSITKAIEKIVEDLSRKIYQQTLRKLRQENS